MKVSAIRFHDYLLVATRLYDAIGKAMEVLSLVLNQRKNLALCLERMNRPKQVDKSKLDPTLSYAISMLELHHNRLKREIYSVCGPELKSGTIRSSSDSQVTDMWFDDHIFNKDRRMDLIKKKTKQNIKHQKKNRKWD